MESQDQNSSVASGQNTEQSGLSQKSPFLNPKFLFVASVILAVGLIIGALYLGEILSNKDQVFESSSDFKITEIDKNVIPFGFPQNFPFEKNVVILKNMKVQAPDGRTQITYEFITQKPLEENFNLYNNYFKNSAWILISVLDEPQYKIISAKSPYEIYFQTIIKFDPVLNANVVTLDLVYKLSSR